MLDPINCVGEGRVPFGGDLREPPSPEAAYVTGGYDISVAGTGKVPAFHMQPSRRAFGGSLFLGCHHGFTNHPGAQFFQFQPGGGE